MCRTPPSGVGGRLNRVSLAYSLVQGSRARQCRFFLLLPMVMCARARSASAKMRVQEAKQSVSAECSYPQAATEQSHLNDSVIHQERGAIALM